MPWGPQKHQLYETPNDAVSVLDHIESALEELGVEDGSVTNEPSIRIFGSIRHWQSKNRFAKFSQKIRFVIEVAKGIDGQGSFLSVGAQGGDVQGTSSKRGVDLIVKALEKRGTKLTPLPYEVTPTELVARLEYGIQMKTIERLIEARGHAWVRANAPENIYEDWREAMIRAGKDPDSV